MFHSYFKTGCYLLFVCGIVSCGMLLVSVGSAWLTAHLSTFIRGVVWVVSPVLSKNAEGFMEVGGIDCCVDLILLVLRFFRTSTLRILSLPRLLLAPSSAIRLF